MWKFSGSIEYTCNCCDHVDSISIEDFDIECVGGSERSMGQENIYDINYETKCRNCKESIWLSFEASEYPTDILNVVINRTEGAETDGEPCIEHLREIYSAEDLLLFYESIKELVTALKACPALMHEITPREFEEVVTEIFRAKGFEVELTQRTADGGKDIIAVSTDLLGIKNKYFIECKRYDKDNKVGVSVVRALHGVKYTKDGPNKTILVTSSTFTSGAKKFVEHEAASKWDVALADYDMIVGWLDGYK